MSKRSRRRKRSARKATVVAEAEGISSITPDDTDALLGSDGGMNFSGVGFSGSIGIGACNHWGGGNMLKNHQRFRTNFEGMNLRNMFSTCRGIAETNWYGGWVCDVRAMYYGAGFQFKGKKAQQWAGQNLLENPEGISEDNLAAVRGVLAGSNDLTEDNYAGVGYDFQQVVTDAIREFVINDQVILLWRVNEDDKLPHIECVNLEDVIYECQAGNYERITFNYNRCDKFKMAYHANPDLYNGFYGRQRCLKMYAGGKYVIYKNGKGAELDKMWLDEEEQEWNFVYRGKGKSGRLNKPAMIGIADDLDFTELIKVGNWNGAWKRKDVLLHAKKGTVITSGNLAGKGRGMPTPTQLKNLSKGISEKEGTATLSTPADTEIEYLTLASEFFGDNISTDSLRRLVNWGGFASMMLMEGFSPAHGVSPYVMNQARSEVWAAREVIVKLLYDVFNHPDFLGDLADTAPLLVPEFDDAVLYNGEELAKRITQMRDSGAASMETVRHWMRLNDKSEGDQLEREHKDRKRVSPAFETNQGLLPAMFPEELGTQADSRTNPRTPSENSGGTGGDVGDPGGRPNKVN